MGFWKWVWNALHDYAIDDIVGITTDTTREKAREAVDFRVEELKDMATKFEESIGKIIELRGVFISPNAYMNAVFMKLPPTPFSEGSWMVRGDRYAYRNTWKDELIKRLLELGIIHHHEEAAVYVDAVGFIEGGRFSGSWVEVPDDEVWYLGALTFPKKVSGEVSVTIADVKIIFKATCHKDEWIPLFPILGTPLQLFTVKAPSPPKQLYVLKAQRRGKEIAPNG